ncbi:RE1-silencing transcription factor [Melanotaenia boesemani]|uniref:RE1-silencing transcription factor n=1 Tax=Melanotaenia boesemani TaxID=1250792 RepID=UPI001C04A447|nr:RE1-silencing transcription factor [Melanotaenia boesemani]XP_041845957.1 RE1-silencing transcription factor [Melanotaenia boesemani]
MAAQTLFSVFPVGVPPAEDGPGLSDMPRNTLPAPQLVMLANVAAVTAGEGGGGDGSVADEKEMMELKTVGSSYSDSEDEGIIRYSYDNQNHREVCIVEYPESPGPSVKAGDMGDQRDEVEDDDEGDKAESRFSSPQPCPSVSAPQQGVKRQDGPPTGSESVKKKKPFRCKPCHFQAQSEQDFVQHLSTHSISKMMVVNQVEGRSKTKAKEAEKPEASSAGQVESSGEPVTSAATSGDIKGLIRCERCGYNTNRYDHYIAHLKHHSKEGDDHRVFKCTLCPYTTVSQYHWRKHLRNHFPSKLHTCSQCSYFSDRKSNYIQHIRTHTGVRPFQCLYCDYSSSQKTHLTRHMRTHSGERPFKCDSCSYLAANQHEVTRHARQVHNGPKPLSCPYCEYKTADRSNFKKHVELHLNPRQFLCPLCKYAASKKCNLQYHIKSRHSGCNVALDVSKVKLRVKRSGSDGADENSKASPGMEEDMDLDDGDDDSCPINLSIKKSGRHGSDQTVPTESPDKAAKKANVSSEKEKTPKTKIFTRQKKVGETPAETAATKDIKPETSPASGSSDKAKKRVKKPPAEKPAMQDQAEEPATQKLQAEAESSGEVQKVWPEKEPQKNENKNLSKNRKTGSRKSVKKPEHEEGASQKPDGPGLKAKVVRDKCTKRKSTEVLDLSQKSSKNKRVKAAEKVPSKPSDGTTKMNGSGPTPKSNRRVAVKHKTRTCNKKGPKEKAPDIDLSSDAPEGSVQPDDPTQTELTGTGPTQISSSTEEPVPPEPEETLSKPSDQRDVSAPRSSGPDPPSPVADQPEPTFIKPTSASSLVSPDPRCKPADPDDDEGIHSSHEGGSDISDSASEGSDDSGLNSTGAGPTKMSNDPETPTDEIPTPTELKSHMCIFCDRTFPLEVEYRRHLNRHLVNVYYMDGSGTSKTLK